MIDPESLETQLHKMMQTILISFNDLHKQDPSTITPEQNQEKAKEIISLSKSLDQSIDQCHYLSNSVEDLDKEIALCLQEKKKKLEDFSEVFNEAEKFQTEFHNTIKNLVEIKSRNLPLDSQKL